MKRNDKNKNTVNTSKNMKATSTKSASLKTTVKAGAKSAAKAATSTAKAVSRFFDAKQLYRVWKGHDLESYKLQGELTICAMRDGSVALMDDIKRGTEIALFKGAQGQAAMIGKLCDIDGVKAIQAGKFALALNSKGFVCTFRSLADFAAYVTKHGEQGEQFSGNFKGLKVLAGSKYSFVSDGKHVWRWEQNTCARGTAFFTSTF